MMRFLQSAKYSFQRDFQERYNLLWNSGAVRTHASISERYSDNSTSIASNEEDIYIGLLTQYTNTTVSIIKNLQRQARLFRDQHNVIAYLQDTIQSTQQDFRVYEMYMTKLFGENSKSRMLVQQTLNYLTGLISEDPNLAKPEVDLSMEFNM